MKLWDYRIGGFTVLAFSLAQSGCGFEYCVGCPTVLKPLNTLEVGVVPLAPSNVHEWMTETVCDEEAPLPYDTSINESCQSDGVVGTMTPIVEWAWDTNVIRPGYDQVMSTPIAGNMTDDNKDGRIDGDDIPDIAFTSYKDGQYSSYGALNVLSGDTGELLWSLTSIGGFRPKGSTGVALADLGDGAGLALFLMTDGGLTAVNVDGTPRWTSEYDDDSTNGWTYPAVYDMEGDGVAEIIVGRSVFEADGSLRWRGSAGMGSSYHISYAMDLDEDGLGEVIAGNTVYNYDGTIRSESGVDGFTAVGDLNGNGRPDIVTVSNKVVAARDFEGAVLWEINNSDRGGGAPTIADFDGDGEPEVGVASSRFYRVYNGDNGGLIWQQPIEDYSSSRTAASVFDFEGDGSAEVVYADEQTLWVFDGATGTVELEWDSHSSGTVCEYPVIVDIDNDGSSEIIVASTDMYWGASNGITVIGDLDESWAPARSIWNQHAYSISNVNDDGTIPSTLPRNWRHRNNFRAGNSETRVGFEQFDLMVGEPDWCLDECERGRAMMWVSIENGGLVSASDIVTTVYVTDENGESVEMARESTTILDEGGQYWLEVPVYLHEEDFPVKIEVFSQQVDSDECDPTNNEYVIEAFPCQ